MKTLDGEQKKFIFTMRSTNPGEARIDLDIKEFDLSEIVSTTANGIVSLVTSIEEAIDVKAEEVLEFLLDVTKKELGNVRSARDE